MNKGRERESVSQSVNHYSKSHSPNVYMYVTSPYSGMSQHRAAVSYLQPERVIINIEVCPSCHIILRPGGILFSPNLG